MKNRYFNTFIHKVTSIDKKEPKICISKFPSEILFYLIHYVRNHWEGGYKGVLFVKEGIRLHRRVFTNSIDTQNCVFEEQVEFYNCIFESLEIKQVSFQKGITIEEQTEFYNCIFESLKIKQVFFQKSITFEGCKLGIRPPDDKGILGEKLPIAVFEGVIFQSDIKYFITHCDSLYFKKCKFEGDININDTEIDNQVVFLDCDFYKDCDFKDIEFKGETSFKGCKFYNRYSKIDFSGCTFNTADFSNTEFKGDLDFSLREEVNGDVKGVVFKNYVDFKNSKIKKAGFKGVIFQNNVYFEGAVLENIDFSGSKFVDPEKDTYMKENQRKEINFSRVEFGAVSFKNSLFEKNVRFHESIFKKEADFYNTSFKKLVDFHGAIFNEAQLFHFTDFSEEAIFANVNFKKEVLFLYCKIESDSYIRFESSIFERGLDISRSNFKKNINFWDITITKEGEQEIFRNLNNQHHKNIKYIDDFGEYSTKEVSMVYRQIRETYRIIKDNFYAQNNRIEGLKFYEKEMSVYLEEKRAQDNLSKAENKTINEIVEKSSKKEIDIRNKYGKIKFIHNLYFLCITFIFLIVNSLFCIVCVLLSPLLLILCAIVNILELKIFDNIYINMKNFINFTFYELHKIKEWNSIIFHFFFISLLVCLLVLYIIYQEYVSYWIMLFVFLLYFFGCIYKIRTNIKENIKNNDYMSLVLLLIPIICFFILLYGENNYQENDFVYREIEYFFFFFKLTEGKNLFILELILMSIAITLAFLPRKQDRILLWFNKNSNSFGTDWVVGINFTMLVALVATIIVLLLSPNMCFLPKWEGIGNFMRALVEMFNITEWKDIEILGERPSNWQYIFIFLARIFIAYGMYQTIQAFRKFGKS